MDNYQLFEEIARGRYSTVYKGREKKTVRYVAIKSINKQRLARVRPGAAGAPPLLTCRRPRCARRSPSCTKCRTPTWWAL